MSALPWQVESLRWTFFYPLGADIPSKELWREIAGAAPEERTEKQAVGVIVESGEWLDNKLTVSSQPGRIDVVFLSPPVPPQLPNLGTYAGALELFRKLPLPFRGVHVNRVAYGAVLLLPGKDHNDCYSTLTKCLPHVGINPASREFQYRINNPKKSKVIPELTINSLSTWAAIRAQFVTIPPSANGEVYATRLELDINTDGNFQLPTGNVSAELAEELIAVGSHIIEHGVEP